MSKGDEETKNASPDISLEEAKFVIQMQSTLYNQIRHQILRILQILLAFVAIIIIGISMAISNNIKILSNVDNYRVLAENAQTLPREYAIAILSLQWFPFVFLSSFMLTGIVMAMAGAKYILTGPGLQPDLGTKFEDDKFSVIKPIENRTWDNWPDRPNRYKEWVSHNSRCLNSIRGREQTIFLGLTVFIVAGVALIGIYLYNLAQYVD